MPINVHNRGELVRITGTFKDVAGALVDPATVTFKYRNPAGTVTTLVYLTDAALVKSSTGVYYVDINANAVGRWFYRWESTGTNQAAEDGQFTVQNDRFD